MTTRDLEQLVRGVVAGSEDGRHDDDALVDRARAAVTDLAPEERTAVVEALRERGVDDLAQRVQEAPFHPVWSDQLSGLARELLSGDPRVTEALATAGGLADQAQEGVMDPRAPSTSIPPPPGADPDVVDEDPYAETVRDGHAADVVASAEPTDAEASNEPTDAEPTDAEASDEPTDAEPTDAEPTDAEPTDAEPTDAEASDGAPSRTTATPATPVADVQRATTARGRVRAVADAPTAALTAEQLTDLVAATPTGWQRRRVLLRLLDGGAHDVPATILGHLARPGDRVAVADRLLRRQVIDLDEVLAELPAGAAARLRRRHGG